MEELKKLITKGEALFNALSVREKFLVLATIMVAVHFIWDGALWQPLHKQHKDLLAKQDTQTKEMVKVGKEVQLGLAKLQQDPDKATKERINVLEEQLKQQQIKAKELETTLIEPGRMAKLLEQMLNRETGLSLVRLKSLKSKPLFTTNAQPAKGAVKRGMVVYQHSFEVEFEGDYLSTLSYLEALRELPWRFFWSRIDYKVNAYPVAGVKLRLYTLSLSKEWIGV